jgi:hypothetical protein
VSEALFDYGQRTVRVDAVRVDDVEGVVGELADLLSVTNATVGRFTRSPYSSIVLSAATRMSGEMSTPV